MAKVYLVNDVRRPFVQSNVSSTGSSVTWINANYLRVEMYCGSGATERSTVAILPFSEYEGLEDEWTAGTNINILTGACLSWTTNYGVTEYPLTSGQKDIFVYQMSIG